MRDQLEIAAGILFGACPQPDSLNLKNVATKHCSCDVILFSRLQGHLPAGRNRSNGCLLDLRDT